MNELQEALNNLDVVNFQIDQYAMHNREVPSVLFTQQAFYQGEIKRLQTGPTTLASIAQEISALQRKPRAAGEWRTWRRPACEVSQEESAYLNSPYCYPAIDA